MAPPVATHWRLGALLLLLLLPSLAIEQAHALSGVPSSRIARPPQRRATSRRARGLSGDSGHGAADSAASSTVLTLPSGQTWGAFCEKLGKWEPSDGKAPAPEPCTSPNSLPDDTKKQKACEDASREPYCVWEHGKCALSHQCGQRTSAAGCELLSDCLWNSGVCEKKTCSSKADELSCRKARTAMGCVWQNETGTCITCSDQRRVADCPDVGGMCSWHAASSAGCREDHSAKAPVCSGPTTESDCNAKTGCTWNTTGGTAKCSVDAPNCSPTNLTEASCTKEPRCRWFTGECKVRTEIICGNMSTKDLCEIENLKCAWYNQDRCVAPWCIEFHGRPVECEASSPACLYDYKEKHCNVNVQCSSKNTATACTAGNSGCLWKEKGCHSHDTTCFGKEQHTCAAITGCKWEETGKCKSSECVGLDETACEGKDTCHWDSHAHTPACAAKEEAGHAEHTEHPPPYNILVIFVIGGLGAFFRHNFSESRIPYTVILFLTGAAFDGLAQLDSLSTLKKFVQLQDIDPHLLFYIFLPVLIFESAFAVDWFIFRTVLAHALILAGPGICTATALTALVAKYAFTYEWTWVMALLFGVTLSATDPVAVVALLKELGASPQISTLIEGESLLNDGTAIVFFNILSSAAAGCSGEIEDSWDALLLELIKVAGGGPLLGYACGMVSVFCLSKVFNDPLIEITTSLVTAYVTFFLAEAYCKVSGVLAVVVCGVYMSHRRQCISPEVHHTLHEFWEMAVYLGNTLIFTMAGMIVAGKAFAHVTLIDFVFLLVTYLAVNVIRFINLKLYAPLYNSICEYKLEGGNMFLVTWGGLRGAVGLALALIVAGDHRLAMREEDDPRTILQNKLVFFTAMIVVFTLVINGVTTQDLVRYFKLDQVSDTKKRMMKENFKRLRQGGMDQLEDLKTEGALYDVNWLEARKWVFDDMCDPYNKDDEFLGEGDPHAEAIMHYYKIMHSSVWEQNEEGLLDGDAVRFLLAKINDKEKAAKKKEAEQLEAMHALVDTADPGSVLAKAAAVGEEQEMDPLMPGSGKTEVAVEYTAGGRTLSLFVPPSASILRLKECIYKEENIPVDQQKLLHAARELDNLDTLQSVLPPGRAAGSKVDLQLDRRNPDEDVLMNADILEEFWNFDPGWYGHVEKLEDRIYKLGKSSFLEKKWTFGFNVAMALVIAHDAVLAKIDNLADPGEANKLKTHAKKVKREVLTQLVQIAKIASKTSTAMKTTLAARTVLNHARSKVWDWQKEGLIEDMEAAVLVRLVEQKMKELTKADNKMPPCNPDYILSQMEWYQRASTEMRDQLRSRRKIERFRRGEGLIKKGEEHNTIMLITAGSARVHVSRRFDYVGPGYCAGLLSALTSTTKYCDIYAETDMSVLSFKADTILGMMHKKGNEAFYQALWRCAGIDVAYKVLRGMEPYSKWAPREVRKFVNRGTLLELPKYRPEDKKLQLSHGCYHVLISGRARDATNVAKDTRIEDLEVLEAPCLLPTDCHEVYLQAHRWKVEADHSQQWFAADEDEAREDEVQVLIVEDPSSASARARKYWEKIYKKIRSIKTTAALRGADVKTALSEAFDTNNSPVYSGRTGSMDPTALRGAMPAPARGDTDLKQPLLARAAG
eukprot:TRINITY_DN46802_c0_g1_i1.p1 TRINITY_DN46802_c0_g1~~TRINITY_DN46802_c0_g1_i1.p1  ORF type:complete len:1617 (+),score=586.36 TRINITY_DN46802_c0_g1_i1:99-4949(+)